VSNDRPERKSAVERSSVRTRAAGVTIGDRFVPPTARHHSQQVATFRALSPALAKRRYGVVAFVGAHVFLWSLVGILAPLSRALGMGNSGAGMVVLLLGILAILTVFVARLSVGADGILLRWLWTQRFLGYHEIRGITRFDKGWLGARLGADGWQHTGQVMGFRVALRSGEEVLMPIALSSRESMADPIVQRIEERIREAMDAFHRDGASVDAPLLRRGERAVGVWVAALRSIGAGANADLRTAPMPRDRLFRIVEDPASPAVDRAAAAVALGGDLDEQTRTRLRFVADATVEPSLRLAVEKAAAGEHQAEIEAALAEIEGKDSRRGVR
jgi:hypothetical protein